MGLVLMRERFSSISAADSIRSKPTLASSSYASRASANDAFSLDGASWQAPPLDSFLEDARLLLLHLPTSLQNRALRQSFPKIRQKTRCSRSPDLGSPTTSSNPGSLGFPGCALVGLFRPVPPITLALSFQRSRSVPRPVVLDVQLSHSSPGAVNQAGGVPALGRWVQTD